MSSEAVSPRSLNGAELRQVLASSGRRIHLIGVAGSGMSGIAGLLLALGQRVSGCDRATTVETGRLQSIGLDFHCPHTPEPLADAELVIYSSAIKPGNLSYDEAMRLGLPMVRRAEALAAIMALREGIVISGMHGKTTTSAMAAWVLRGGDLHPSHYVGAEIPILGTNAHWDPEGSLFVAEGDESDGTLRLYQPAHAIVLNVEPEHLDFYRDMAEIDAVFNQLLSQTREKIVYCADDANATRLCAHRSGAISYSLIDSTADYACGAIALDPHESHFEVLRRGERLGTASLHIPGRHNVSNALAVIALACELGMNFNAIRNALAQFQGAKRRFEVLHHTSRYCVIDDYGHHPTEIRATLQAAASSKPQRILVMFQPHRYTRTQLLQEEFGTAFEQAHAAFITDVYPASEKPIPGVSGQLIVDRILAHGAPAKAKFVPQVADLPFAVGPELRPGDLLLSLGAGNIHEAAKALLPHIKNADELTQLWEGRGKVRVFEPLSRHTTLKVGGPADLWAEPETMTDFQALIHWCRDRELSLMVIGRGSNLLVRDGGLRGVVAHLGGNGDFGQMEVYRDRFQIAAGAGVKFKELAAAARKAEIGGFEWMEGIPGAVGGGLRMNAGAMGIETFDQVVTLVVIDGRTGERRELTRSDLEVHYRNVPALSELYAVSAVFQGEHRGLEEIDAQMAASKEKRKTSQPVAASSGCTFKNPETIPAGKLIDELGLKDLSVRGARVSEVHANFIVNDGEATAADVLELIGQIQARARQARGIDLHTEVQIVGEEQLPCGP